MNQIASPIYPNNGIQFYVSSQIGNDSNTGSISAPLATFGAAITLAGTPSAPVIITGLDGNTYDEQLVINNTLIYFNAPYARLLYTGSGDAVTINAMDSGFPFIIGEIGATSGNALVNTSTDIVIANIGSLLGGNVLNSGTGTILLQSDIVSVDINNTSSGTVFYQIVTRIGGSDSSGVVGLSAQGVSGPFNITGYNYPVGGTPAAGYVMTTDGSNNLSLQPASGGSSFTYENAYWVSQANGNDSNSGTSINTPLATFQAAINLIGSNPTIIYGVDGNAINDETITTLGTAQNLIIVAPGTTFQQAVTIVDPDSVTFFIQSAFNIINNSTNNVVFNDGSVTVTTSNSGITYANVNQYTGTHTGGGGVFINCNQLNAITLDSSMTAFVEATYSSGISNAGTLSLFTTTSPGSCITSNTGTISGFVGGVSFGTFGVTGSGNTAAAYSLPTTDGSAGQSFQTDGAGTVTWGNSINPYPNLSVPYAAFNYFVSTDNDGIIWSYTTSLNGNPYALVTNGLDFGTLNFTILPGQEGTYRFTVSYITDTNLGIQNIICDGVTTTIDMYSASTVHSVNLSWEQTMTAGAKTIQLINNGKNASSTGYYVSWCNNEIQIFRVS